jgi:hypothetical protein
MTLYTEVIRNLIYENPEKYKVLVSTGLFSRYMDAIVLLDKLNYLYEREEVEQLVKKIGWIDVIRGIAIDYVVTYILIRNPDNKELAKSVADLINTQVSITLNYIQALIETILTKVRGEVPRILSVSQLLAYFGDLIEFYKEIFTRPIDDVIAYLLYRRQYISALVEERSKIAKKIKELRQTVEEVAEQPETEESNRAEELSAAATDAKLEYIKSLYNRPLVSPRPIFSDKEVNLILTLLQRGALYPKLSISIDELASTLNMNPNDTRELINSIWNKCKVYGMGLFITVHKETDAATGKEVEYVSIDPDIFRKSLNKIAQAHPDLAQVFLYLGLP